MLIYTNRNGGCHNPFGAMSYKSASNRKRSGTRAKTPKRNAHRRQPKQRKVVKKSSKRKSKKKKKLNANNVKFLKKLGFKVKKH